MTKLWSYEIGEKIGDYSNVATLRTNVATLQKRCCTKSRRSGSVFGGFLAHFEPIMEGFEAKTRKRRKGKRLGLGKGDFVHTLGPRRRLGAVF